MQVIVHINDNGVLCVTVPTQEVLDNYGIEWIKNKDTPPSSIIIDDSKLDLGVKAFCNLVFDYSKLKTSK